MLAADRCSSLCDHDVLPLCRVVVCPLLGRGDCSENGPANLGQTHTRLDGMMVRMRTTHAENPTPPKQLVGRSIVERLALVLVAIVLLQTWYLEGLVAPMKVTSNSMAPTLLGPHQEAVCTDCAYRFAYGTEGRLRRKILCPNCGFAEECLSSSLDTGGEWLLVSRSIFALRRPQRWEVAAFRHPEQASQIALKRIVGLPGETVEIRDGEIYANGVIQRKPLAQQQAMAVPVYDANHVPQHDSLPPRWQGDEEDSRWVWSEGRLLHSPAPEQESFDWLSYHHWCRLPGQPDKVQQCPITNTSGYNQGSSERCETVHPVGDLWLSFRLQKAEGDGEFCVLLTDGREEFQVEFVPARGHYEVRQNGRKLELSGSSGLPVRLQGSQIDVSLVDSRFTVAFDGRVAAEWAFAPGPSPPPPTLRPVAIGVRRLEVEIGDLRLYRDVYYTHPLGPDARWGGDRPGCLGTGEYFVLGDNSLISLDSRTWPQSPAVPDALLVGKPFCVALSTRRISWGRMSFVVPVRTGIRYIR